MRKKSEVTGPNRLPLSQLSENRFVEFGADPESGTLQQVVQNRLHQVDQASPLCVGEDPEQTGDPQPRGLGRPSCPSFIDKQQLRVTFYREHDRFGFTGVQTVTKLLHTLLIFRSPDDQRRHEVDIRHGDEIGLDGQFRKHRRRDEDLPVQKNEKF